MEQRGRRADLARRAILALVLLVGYYVLGVFIAGGLLYVAWVLVFGAGVHGPFRLVAALVTGAVAILWSLVPRRDAFTVDGLLLTREAQPRLFAAIDGVAARTGQAAPAEVYLVPEVNAFVLQRGGFLGFGGRRVMGVGLPLLAALSPRQAETVIAHEFGHYAAGDTRLAPLVYQARAAVGRTLTGLGDSVLHLPFRWYGTLFMRISQQIARRQEFAADEVAARLTDPVTAIASLRRLPGTTALFERFIRADFHPVLARGFRPSLVDGFRRALAAPEHAEWTAKFASEVLDSEPDDPYASHPTMRARIAALQSMAGPNADAHAGATDDGATVTGARDSGTGDDGTGDERALVWLDGIDALETALVDTLFVDGRAPAMQPIRWEDVGDDLVVPSYVANLARLREHLAGLRPIDLPPPDDRREALLADFTGRKPETLSDAAAHNALATFVALALSVALVRRGWRLHSLPERLHATLTAPDASAQGGPAAAGGDVDPFRLAESLLDGTLAADEWRAMCASWRIADIDLAVAVDAERERQIEAGRLVRPAVDEADAPDGAGPSRGDGAG